VLAVEFGFEAVVAEAAVTLVVPWIVVISSSLGMGLR
jgi:hypothetical protein